MSKIPILMYHQVSDKPHTNYLDYTVTIKAFKAQMNILKLLGYKTINLDNFYNCRSGQDILPPRPIIITFDDGMREAIDNCIPILVNLGFSATFFMPTKYVGRMSNWMLSTVDVEFQVIDWSAIRYLDKMGFEIGAHTISHPSLDEISTINCRNELEGSRRVLEEYLGHEVRHMAYPFGRYNHKVLSLTKESGFYTACTTEERICDSRDHLLELPRINLGMGISLFEFIFKLYATNSTVLIRKYSAKVLPKRLKQIIKNIL